jgi:hypothetical protein
VYTHLNISEPDSNYSNFKKFSSVVLKAVADAIFAVIAVSIADYGRKSGSGVLSNPTLVKPLSKKRLIFLEISRPLVILMNNFYISSRLVRFLLRLNLL